MAHSQNGSRYSRGGEGQEKSDKKITQGEEGGGKKGG